ncbi:MAG: lysophospholipid acyltransferase family protein [Myxococcota bacterium]
MIPHRKRAVFNWVFVAYARWLLRGHFHAIRISGMEHAVAALSAGPLVGISNHSAWWDPIVLMWLSNYPFRRAVRSNGYAMMDAKNLKKLSFFRYLGVFGVSLDDAKDRASVIPYAASLLEESGDQVWLYPQGAERPITERPVRFRRGGAAIAHQAGVVVLPMALRYEHGKHPKPTCYLAFGEALPAIDGGEADVAAQEAAMERLLDHLGEAANAASRGADPVPVALWGRRNPIAAFASNTLSRLTGRRPRQ